MKATDNVANAKNAELASNANQVEAEEIAAKAKEEEATTGKVEAIDDEFCTDEVYLNLKTKSVETQTLETGPLPNTPSKPGFDYYSLSYDDLSDWTPEEVTVFSPS